MTIIDGVTLGIALLGAVLGVLNTVQSIDRDRVKLRVSVRIAYFFVVQRGPPEPQVSIVVMNRSQFPLTISQIGFQMRGSENVLTLFDPIFADGGKLPRRLESRSLFTAYFSAEDTRKLPTHNLSRAYANTDSGETAYSSRRALRKLLKSLTL